MKHIAELNKRITEIKANAAESDNCPNMAVLTVGYRKLVLPVEDAMAVLMMLKHAEVLETTYTSVQGEIVYIGGKLPEISIAFLDKTRYIEGIINGPKTDN